MSITKRQKTNLKKLAQAALKTSDEDELNKLAIALVKLGLLDRETTAVDQGEESPGSNASRTSRRSRKTCGPSPPASRGRTLKPALR